MLCQRPKLVHRERVALSEFENTWVTAKSALLRDNDALKMVRRERVALPEPIKAPDLQSVPLLLTGITTHFKWWSRLDLHEHRTPYQEVSLH
jgi:hypothetical protein